MGALLIRNIPISNPKAKIDMYNYNCIFNSVLTPKTSED